MKNQGPGRRAFLRVPGGNSLGIYCGNTTTPAPHVESLDALLGEWVLAFGDLILAELLQGFATEQDAWRALNLLEPLEFLEMAGRDVAIQSAANYRRLRRRGVTVRKTMDILIGTYCLMHDHEVLHNDRDFDVLATHLGSKAHRN